MLCSVDNKKMMLWCLYGNTCDDIFHLMESSYAMLIRWV